MAALRSSTRLTFRRAAIASAVLHMTLAVTVVVVLRSRPEPVPRASRIDTKADEVAVRFLADPILVETRPTTPHEEGSRDPAPMPSAPSPSGDTLPPLAAIPRTLPAELIAVIRRSAADRTVRPVSASQSAPEVPAIHGALETGQTIVYVLDSSGSMGEHGKLDRAKAALLATLRVQPEGVRFQVIAYSSTARVVSGSGTAPATAANITAAGACILAIEASGRSNHAAAIRLAAQCRPDLILVVTDAEGLTHAQFAPVLAAADKPIALCVARVTPSGIRTPQAIR